MDKNYLVKNLKEISAIIETMLDNIDNTDVLKFFAGKLSLSIKKISSLLTKNN